MLPNESLFDVLRLLDYNTLVAAKFTTTRFLHVVAKYADELPRQHSFFVFFNTSYVSYRDLTINARLKSAKYEPGNRASLAAACREVAEVIGAHAVGHLIFSESTWDMPGVGVVFETAPALKYTAEVGLNSREGQTIVNDSEAFMSNFARMKTLRLLLDYDVFRQFNWTLLRHECARELRLIKGRIPNVAADREDEMLNRSLEELVRHCVSLPRLLDGEALELDFSGNRSSPAFALSIIELLRNTGSKLNFRMRTPRHGEPGGELILAERDYTIDVNNASTRYTSEKSGIVVEVKEAYTVITSTATVIQTKPMLDVFW